MIEQNLKSLITKKTTQEYLQLLVGKDAWISCGYGGVIFLEVDGLQKHVYRQKGKIIRTLYSGEYRIFCEDNWEYVDKERRIERWKSRSQDVDTYFENLGIQTIAEVVVEGEFEKIHFYFSSGSCWTVIKDDALETLHFTLAQEKKRIYIKGDGTIELYQIDEYPVHSWRLPTTKKLPKAKKKELKVSTDFFQQHYPGLFTLSHQKAVEQIRTLSGKKVEQIQIDSATTFTLSDLKNDQWRIAINELWQLKKNNQIILDAKKDKFHFKEILEKELLGKQIVAITFSEDGKDLDIQFEDNLNLSIRESDRYTRWDIMLISQGLDIRSLKEQGMVYRAEYPHNSFETGDIYFNAILKELYFYRSYFGGGKIKGWNW